MVLVDRNEKLIKDDRGNKPKQRFQNLGANSIVIPTTVPQDQKFSFDMKRTRPNTSAATNTKDRTIRETTVTKDGMEWSPEFTEISFI